MLPEKNTNGTVGRVFSSESECVEALKTGNDVVGEHGIEAAGGEVGEEFGAVAHADQFALRDLGAEQDGDEFLIVGVVLEMEDFHGSNLTTATRPSR
jgi:hypothetical protein